MTIMDSVVWWGGENVRTPVGCRHPGVDSGSVQLSDRSPRLCSQYHITEWGLTVIEVMHARGDDMQAGTSDCKKTYRANCASNTDTGITFENDEAMGCACELVLLDHD